jgi:anaerobic ribonucleoside-triphosphate reductase
MKSVIRSSNELQSMSFTRSAEIRNVKNRNREFGDDDDEAETVNDETNEDIIDDRMVGLAAQIK